MTSAKSSSDREGELRRRTAKISPTNPDNTSYETHSTRELDHSSPPTSAALDIIRAVFGLIFLSAIASYVVSGGESYIWHATDPTRRPWFLDTTRVLRYFDGPLELTNDELAHYDGSDSGTPIYLALNRTIYDVSSSAHVYGPGGMYASLAAKDASRSYITTCFDPVEDLVPYFGGVEEVYVPLWLSKRSKKQLKPEFDAIAIGEVAGGKDAEDIIDTIRQKVGRKKFKLLQKEAYEDAMDRVREQVRTWENMFANKAYPKVGRVVGVDEYDENKWRHLGFCDEIRKLRPPMGETLQKAMSTPGKDSTGGNIGLNMMGKDSSDGKDKGRGTKKNTKKGTKKDKDSTDHGLMGDSDHENNNKAYVKIEDMMQGGKYAKKKKARKIEEIAKNNHKGDDDDTRAMKAMEDFKEAQAKHGENGSPEIPDAVPQELIDHNLPVDDL